MSDTRTQYPQQNFQQQAAPTEGLAIAALITGLLFWPAGLIISPMALSRIKRNHTGGRGMAIAGLIRFLRTRSTNVFIAYRIVLAAVVLIAWLG